jgi:myo-inositol-1(or 4)-monophosphatase
MEAMTTPLELMRIAQLLASEASTLITRERESALIAHTKSSAVDVVTHNDLAAEALLRSRLRELRPLDAVFGEEGHDSPGTSGITWVLDPIDGTVNYLYGLPFFAVSVAAVRGTPGQGEWESLAGAVATGVGAVYTAAQGQGAWRDGARLHRGEPATLDHTLLGTGFQYQSDRRTIQGRILAQLVGQVRDIRRLGAAAVDLCLVADGTLDAYYEHGLNPWDFAAGALVAQEAGVRIGNLAGARGDDHLLIAAVEPTWQELCDALQRAGAADTW